MSSLSILTLTVWQCFIPLANVQAGSGTGAHQRPAGIGAGQADVLAWAVPLWELLSVRLPPAARVRLNTWGQDRGGTCGHPCRKKRGLKLNLYLSACEASVAPLGAFCLQVYA